MGRTERAPERREEWGFEPTRPAVARLGVNRGIKWIKAENSAEPL
jgi:hypothetical protein